MKKWLQLFRAQTAPATFCLVMLPYLMNANLFTLQSLILFIYCIFLHWFSFGHNSLMDFAMGYDKRDPSKSHHPLNLGILKLTRAHNVIHWGLLILAVVGALMTIYYSPRPDLALLFFVLYLAFGHAYNDGLSKESLFGFIPISICFTSLGLWGWFLSHSSIDLTGWVLALYFFFTILFQIAYEGHLKELEIKERSNLLISLGATINITDNDERMFNPHAARYFAWLIKGINVVFGGWLCYLHLSLVSMVVYVLLLCMVAFLLHRLTKPRKYVRGKELMNMSVMEICTIYLPIPILLPWLEASVLMIAGVLYFFIINKLLWEVPYPKV